jgi:hypothetical protein
MVTNHQLTATRGSFPDRKFDQIARFFWQQTGHDHILQRTRDIMTV